MADNLEAPKIGDMYRCSKCAFEIHVTGDCDSIRKETGRGTFLCAVRRIENLD